MGEMGPQNSFKRMFKVNDVVYWARFSTNGLSLQLSIEIIQKFLYGGAKFILSVTVGVCMKNLALISIKLKP